MSHDTIPYDRLLLNSMQLCVREALKHNIDGNSFPSGHHCYIQFKSNSAGVNMPDDLKAKYTNQSGQMAVVLQNKFESLEVGKKAFSVTLFFSGVPATLTVPYDAVTLFSDPYAQFSLEMDFIEGEQAPPACEEDQRDAAQAGSGDDKVTHVDFRNGRILD